MGTELDSGPDLDSGVCPGTEVGGCPDTDSGGGPDPDPGVCPEPDSGVCLDPDSSTFVVLSEESRTFSCSIIGEVMSEFKTGSGHSRRWPPSCSPTGCTSMGVAGGGAWVVVGGGAWVVVEEVEPEELEEQERHIQI